MTIIICFRLLIFQVLLVINISFMLVGATLNFSDINSYAKVSRSGSGLSDNFKSSLENSNNEARSFQASPVYVSSKISNLKNGEAFDYPSTQRYSTLDEELLAKYDDVNLKKQAQDRFHPPPKFEHSIAHSNAVRQQSNNENSSSPPGSSPSASSSSGNYQTLPKQIFSNDYNYPSTLKPIMDNLPSITIDNYSPDNSFSQQPVSYVSQKMPYQGPDNLPSYLEKFPSKPQFPSYIDTTFPIDNEHLSFHHDHEVDDEHNHELIYDHPPDHYDYHDHHDHHHHHMTMTTTTEEPEEMNDQRLSKRPYSYYYLGKKLWYLPLYFSIYFIIYIGALVLKSIARHKINFPSTLANIGDTRSINNIPDWWDLTKIVLDAIDDITTRLHD